jgi:RimJ/RimL family protein N-acetyltransferase
MIKGTKTGLRAVEPQDLEKLKDWRNITDFRKNFREHRELNQLQQEQWYANVSNSKNDFMFSIVDIKSSELIGACGLLYVNWIARYADFSFYIGKNNFYIDKEGYADCATTLLLNYAFKTLNLNKVWMELYEFDETKLKFFTEKFGFQKDGTLRQNCFENGKYYDSYIISLLSSDRKKD